MIVDITISGSYDDPTVMSTITVGSFYNAAVMLTDHSLCLISLSLYSLSLKGISTRSPRERGKLDKLKILIYGSN